MASRSRMSAAAVRSTSVFCSVISTADADQVHAGFAGLVHQLATHPQPDPFAAGVMHAEVVVDGVGPGIGELGRDLVELDVVGMHELADLAEGHQIVAGRQAQDREHRVRPEDAAAREVPIPEAAAAAVERGVDAASHGVVDRIGLARAGGLPVKGKAQDQQHEAGGGGERDGQRGVGSPGRERIAAQLEDAQLTAGGGERAHRREGAVAVGERNLQHAGAGAEDGERLRLAEHVDQARADRPAGRGGRGDDAVGIAEQDAAAERRGAGRSPDVSQVAGSPTMSSGRTGTRVELAAGRVAQRRRRSPRSRRPSAARRPPSRRRARRARAPRPAPSRPAACRARSGSGSR